jgi:hypothetical protein
MLLFFGCSAFTGSLTIPNSVDSIGMGAFRNCSGFTGSLTIPDSVTLIEMVAFQRCSGFKIIDISSWTDIPTILSYSFDEFNPEGGTVLVPENYVQLGIALSTFDGLPST